MSAATKHLKDMAIVLKRIETAEEIEKKELLNKFWNMSFYVVTYLELDEPFFNRDNIIKTTHHRLSS